MYKPTTNESHGGHNNSQGVGISNAVSLRFVKVNDFNKPKSSIHEESLLDQVVSIYEQEFSPNIRLSTRKFRKQHKCRKYETIGVFDGNDPVGFVSLLKIDNLSLIHIDYIAVQKKYQGRGYARHILNHIFHIAENKNISLECEPNLEPLYFKFGFKNSNISYKFKHIPMFIMLKTSRNNNIHSLAKNIANILKKRNESTNNEIAIIILNDDVSHICQYPENKLRECLHINRRVKSGKRDVWQQKS